MNSVKSTLKSLKEGNIHHVEYLLMEPIYLERENFFCVIFWDLNRGVLIPSISTLRGKYLLLLKFFCGGMICHPKPLSPMTFSILFISKLLRFILRPKNKLMAPIFLLRGILSCQNFLMSIIFPLRCSRSLREVMCGNLRQYKWILTPIIFLYKLRCWILPQLCICPWDTYMDIKPHNGFNIQNWKPNIPYIGPMWWFWTSFPSLYP